MKSPNRNWIGDYFCTAQEQEQINLSNLKTVMGKLRMDTTIENNCPSRVMKLVKDFDNVLLKLPMEGFQTEEPKQTQEWLINALQPLRRRIE